MIGVWSADLHLFHHCQSNQQQLYPKQAPRSQASGIPTSLMPDTNTSTNPIPNPNPTHPNHSMLYKPSSTSKQGDNSKPSNVAPWRRSRCVLWKQCVCNNSSADRNHAGTDKISAVKWIKTTMAGIPISAVEPWSCLVTAGRCQLAKCFKVGLHLERFGCTHLCGTVSVGTWFQTL